MRLLYTLIFYLLSPLIPLYLLWLARRSPAFARRWNERFGWFRPLETEKVVVWLHTASVGEFLAALPLIRTLLQDPELQLVITTTTPTGSERLKQALGDRVFHVYAPCDLPGSVRRFLSRVQPRVLLTMETELWPNTIAACARREIPVVLVNGRLSERSARGYQRFVRLIRPMMGRITDAGIQNRADAERFQELGLRPEATHITGNIKFDLTLDPPLRERAAQLRRHWQTESGRLIWIAASTHRGEDELILEAFARVREQAGGNPLLVLVPRHPQRFEDVYRLCERRGFTCARRSANPTPEVGVQVLVGDTMGELLLMFGASDLAFVGGSLVPNGGHNLVEPAAWGLPLLSGPSLFNFAEVARLLRDRKALRLAADARELAQAVIELLADEALRRQMGAAAQAVADDNRGALEATLKLVRRYC